SDTIRPLPFDRGAPVKFEAKFGEERNGGVDVFYHKADVVHSLDRHDVPWRLTDAKPFSGRGRPVDVTSLSDPDAGAGPLQRVVSLLPHRPARRPTLHHHGTRRYPAAWRQPYCATSDRHRPPSITSRT